MSLLSVVLMAGLGVILATNSQADPQSKSFSTWQYTAGEVRSTFTISTRELTRLPAARSNPDLAALMVNHLRSTVAVSTGITGAGQQTCPMLQPQPQRVPDGLAGRAKGAEPAGAAAQSAPLLTPILPFAARTGQNAPEHRLFSVLLTRTAA